MLRSESLAGSSRAPSLAAACAIVMAACGEAAPVQNDAGPPAPRPVSVQNIAAYEGQGAFVTVLESGGDDWTGASVSSMTGGLDILAQRCNATLCAVLARVPDRMRNTGQTIPAPIDAAQELLVVTAAAGRSQGLVRVFPTDALTATGETEVSGPYFAASVTAGAGSVIRGAGSEPIRWVVFGSAEIDTFDVSAGVGAGPGGGEGGNAGMDGQGAGGGAAASGTAGAGGGASFEPGAPGAMAAAGADAVDAGCAADFFASSCGGGGGGGGAGGAGGPGAGSVAIVVLGSACVSRVRGVGAQAAAGTGGGGGGGGLALVASSMEACATNAEMSGGAGDGTGGAGGAGVLVRSGTDVPRIVFEPPQLITSDATFMVRGVSAAGRSLRVERVTEVGSEELGTGASASDGTFAVAVTLTAGLNRLRVTQSDADGSNPVRAFNGNHIELERRDGFVRQLPVGGLLDVAYVP